MSKQALLLSTFAISLLLGCSRDRTGDGNSTFPTRNQTRLLLHENDDEISFRFVHRSADKKRVEKIVTEFRDGVTEHRIFRPDTTLEKLKQHYPASAPDKERQLRVFVLYDEDGKTVLYERVYQPDGSLAVVGSRGPEGNYRREHFFEGGKGLKKIELFNRWRRLLVEQFYREDGNYDRIVQYDGRRTTTTMFREDGTLEHITVRTPGPYSPVDRTFFSPNGMVKLMRVRYNANSVHVTYFENGKEVETRNIYRSGTTTVVKLDKNGNKLIQVFDGDPDAKNWTNVSNRRLTRVTEYDGKTKVKRVIEFYEDGKTPKEVRLPDGHGSVYKTKYKYYRPDGTLKKEEYKEDYKTTKDEKEYTVEDDVREDIPDEFFELEDRKAPELLTKMPEEQPYGCEMCCGEGCENCMD